MIEFRPLQKDGLPLVRDWLARPHVREWWRDPLDKAIATEEEPTQQFLVVVDDAPVGMIQTYLASDYPEWDEIVKVGEGVAAVDLFIGEAEHVGRGLGPQILVQFVRDVITADAVVATVEEANRRSWRAFEKAGFRHVADVVEDGLPHRLLRLDRRYAQ